MLDERLDRTERFGEGEHPGPTDHVDGGRLVAEQEVERRGGIGARIGSGTVRVIANVHQMHLVQQGDILVAASTGPTFNVVLPLLGGIVTERGGALSHAAIVAREYGIPGVVGCPGALAAISTSFSSSKSK